MKRTHWTPNEDLLEQHKAKLQQEVYCFEMDLAIYQKHLEMVRSDTFDASKLKQFFEDGTIATETLNALNLGTSATDDTADVKEGLFTEVRLWSDICSCLLLVKRTSQCKPVWKTVDLNRNCNLSY